MPSFHIIICVDLLLVYAPTGGRPGSALYPGAIDILHKLLQGSVRTFILHTSLQSEKLMLFHCFFFFFLQLL